MIDTTNLKYPLFEACITDDNTEGIERISMVEAPAVGNNLFMLFDENKPLQLFKKNEDLQLITGVAMLANTPIYRRYGDSEYYIYFSPETILKSVEKYNKEQRTNLLTLHHKDIKVEAILVESYIISEERGVKNTFFSDIPDGSWVVTYKINDTDLWEQLKTTNDFNGFSIECVYAEIPSEFQYIDPEIEVLEEMLNIINKIK